MNFDIFVHSPAFILGIPLLFAFLTPLVNRLSEQLRNVVFGIGLVLTAFFVGLMSYQVLTEGSWLYVFGANQPEPQNLLSYFYFRITFVADSFAVLATITISITAVAAGIYSYGFMKDETGLNKFYTLFLLTLAGVNGMVLTGDLFNLFVWFEVTSVASCALVAFRNYRGRSVEAALKYMVLSTVGGLLVLFSIGLMYGQYGVLNYALLTQSISGTFIDKLALGLLVVIFAMKASSAPMHMWAPDAYSEAPGSVTPFIAITSLGSLFVLFRLLFGVIGVNVDPSVSGTLLIILGVLSMIVGVTMALVQTDLKRLIAYLSVSQVGYMMMAVGVGLATLNSADYQNFGTLAMKGGLFHMINDGVYKALLFLSAVAVVHVTDIRSLNKLGGLAHDMPYTTVFFLIGALSIAGIPPLSGFSSKLLIYQSVYLYSPVLAIVALVVSIITLAVVGKAFFNAFLGPDQGLAEKKVPSSMLFGMGLLTVVVIIFTLFPNLIVSEIVSPAVKALVGVMP
ncbi:MAG: NADH:ubiquinone oxidoreductase [Candidatus Thermoplasmatota archaeon]|nr:NADH:ubiquinone oxidoreductase [Candidatus Thermoplasmatota archaeon]